MKVVPYTVQIIMDMIENYRMSGGSAEHHRRKAALEHELAGLVAAVQIQPCPGIPRKGCNYTAACNSICNKCGEVHHSHQLVTPTFSISTDTTAVVSNDAFWIPIDANTPRGKKLWLINKPAGSATQGQYDLDPFWTHYFPLPRFKKDESDET